MQNSIRLLARSLTLLLIGALGCDSTSEEPTGSLRVRTFTAGLDIDPDGYRVLAGDQSLPIDPEGTVTLEATVGALEVRLDEVAANCVAASGAVVAVDIVEGRMAEAAFAVECRAEWGVVGVAVPTTGLDFDGDGYMIQLNQSPPRRVVPNETTYFFFVNRGDHHLHLTDVAGNCSVPNNGTAGLTMTAGGLARDTVQSVFAVTCGATSGVLELLLATTGVPSDPTRFMAQVDGGTAFRVWPGDTTRIVVAGASHRVTLQSLPDNCVAEDGMERSLTLALGGPVRDTVRAAFRVGCVGTHGVLRIKATTTGTELDADGYQIGVDCYWEYYSYYQTCSTVGHVGANGTRLIPLLAGRHALEISQVASNCTLQGEAVREVVIASDDTVEVALEVTCAAALRATTVRPGAAERRLLETASTDRRRAPWQL